MNRINTRFLLVVLLAALLAHPKANAQLPRAGLVYMDYDTVFLPAGTESSRDSIYIYDPGQPVSATNPVLNSIILPHNNGGLAVSPVLGSGDSTLTFYTQVGGTYWYYDPNTHIWVNTGHLYGPPDAPNFAAGGGYIYSISGLTGVISRYDGTGDATEFTGFVVGAIPYDMLADCSGNFCVLRAADPYMNMEEFSSDHVFIQGWSVVNPNFWTPSGGVASIGNNIYTDIEFNPQIAHFTVSATDVTFENTTPDLPFLVGNTIGDMASVAGGAMTDILPTITIASSDTILCQGGTISLTSTVLNADSTAQYQWFVNGVAFSGAISGSFTYQPHDGDVINAHLTTAGACSDMISTSPSITIHVSVTTATLSYAADSFCTDLGTIIPALATPVGGNYTANNGLAINNTTGAIKLAMAAPGSYEVTYTAGSGACIAIAKDTLLIETTPTVKLTISNTDICYGDTIRLTWLGDSVYHYAWQPGYYSIIPSAGDTASVTVSHSGYIGVVATDAFCTARDSIYINAHSCCQVAIPSAFTPNDDGLNDLFCPVSNGHYKLESFIVQNRWGQTVFKSSDSKPCWDGKLNGIPAETGAYFYLLRYSCLGSGAVTQEKGDVTLIR